MVPPRSAAIAWLAALLTASTPAWAESTAAIAEAQAIAAEALKKLGAGDVRAAAKLIERAKRTGAADPEVLVAEANIDIATGNPTAAIRAAERAAATAPGLFAAHGLLCGLYLREAERTPTESDAARTRGEFARAVAACRNALRTSDPSSRRPVLYELEARALSGTGDRGAAAGTYRSWIAFAPDDGRAYAELAVLLDELGDVAQSTLVLSDAEARSAETGRTARYAFVLGRFDMNATTLLPMIDVLLEDELLPDQRTTLAALADALRGQAPSSFDALFEIARHGKLPAAEVRSLWRRLDPVNASTSPVRPSAPGSSESEAITLPRVIFDSPPAYPVAMRRQRIEGWVVLGARIEVDGHVRDVLVLEASDPRFVSSAVAAAKLRRYVPGRRGTEPIPIVFTMRMDFRFR